MLLPASCCGVQASLVNGPVPPTCRRRDMVESIPLLVDGYFVSYRTLSDGLAGSGTIELLPPPGPYWMKPGPLKAKWSPSVVVRYHSPSGPYQSLLPTKITVLVPEPLIRKFANNMSGL